MSRTVDRILALLDNAHQSTDEPDVSGDDSVGEDRCVRCRGADRLAESDFCEACRAFLLGDTHSERGPTAHVHMYVYMSVEVSHFDGAGRVASVTDHDLLQRFVLALEVSELRGLEAFWS